MTDELREQLAKELCRQMGEDSWENLPLERPYGKASYLGLYKQQFYHLADPIRAIIDSHFPQLAKEKGYVKLAEDQMLPRNPFLAEAYRDGELDMFKAGFRKVVLE